MPRFVELSTSWRRHWRALAITLLCMAAGLAQAQSGVDDSADPPSRVARLSYIAGDLGFLPAGAKDWSDANINRPLTTGDKLSTAQGARAELEFGGGTLRIDGRTDFGLLDLNDQLAQIELTQGTLSLTVRRLDDGQSYEIDTPAVALVVDQPGTFRVDIDERDGSTRVTAFDGGATVFGENNAQRSINPGRSYRFVDPSLDMVTITDIDGGDAFDAWASERDRRYAQSDSSQYVSDDVVGYQDLDQYGAWQDTSEYGAVWFPRDVGANWAPYRDGHWAYIAPWGWTWVDDAPWGFAPYHYGRWAYVRGGWGWIPGPRDVRPIYAPALVAFVGGGGWSVGIGGAPVGWFPLGPGEFYNPWYRCGRNYYANVNIRNIRGRRGYDPRHDIDDHYNRYRRGQPGRGDRYVNRDAPRGFTAVPGRSFAGGRHVQRDMMRIDPRKLADAPVLPRGVDRARPIADAARPPRNTHARDLPAGGFNRQVVARRAPPMIHDDLPVPGRSDRFAAKPRSNVRVLDNQGGQGRGERPSMADRNDNIPRRPVTAAGQLPAVPRIAPATPSRRPDMVRDDGELRSARFAHPRGRDDTDRRVATPRPGVSYIAPAAEDRSRAIPGNRPMPSEVPQIRRAEPRRMPADDNRFQRYQPDRVVQRERPQPTAPAREPAAPRFQRPEPAPRAYVREQPRPMPNPDRGEPMPQRYQPPPRAMPQPRAAPPPRAETPRPQRSEARPSNRKNAERVREDERQH